MFGKTKWKLLCILNYELKKCIEVYLPGKMHILHTYIVGYACILSVQLTEFSQIRHTFVISTQMKRQNISRTAESTLMLISMTPSCNSWNKSGGNQWSWCVIWLPNWVPKFWCFVPRGNQRKSPCLKAQLSKYSFDLVSKQLWFSNF